MGTFLLEVRDLALSRALVSTSSFVFVVPPVLIHRKYPFDIPLPAVTFLDLSF